MRQYYQLVRNQLAHTVKDSAARHAANHLAEHPLFGVSEHIACYASIKNEISTRYVIDTILQANKKCYLPVLVENKSLKFAVFQMGDALSANHYRILEPTHRSELIEGSALDMVLLPLLAFDKQGNRLGMGGGYYDRTFSFKKERLPDKPWLIGLGFSEQQATDLPHDEWDVTLNGVITEDEFLLF